MALAQEAVVADQSAQLLMALGLRLRASGADPIPFLELVQKEYPGDFLASYTLGEAIWTKDVGDCIRFYQAALAAWPSSAAAQAAMGPGAREGRPPWRRHPRTFARQSVSNLPTARP